MDLLPTDEQLQITATIREVLSDRFPMNLLDEFEGAESVRSDAWAAFGELGWFSLGIDEDHGGVGYGPAEEALLFRELGISAAPGPFLAQVIGAHLAVAGGHPRRDDILAGATIVGWADRTAGDRWLLQHHDAAELFVGSDSDGIRLIDASAFTDIEPIPSLDPLTPLARAVGTTVADASLGADRAQVLLAAQLAGIALASAEQSTEYAKVRHQFGQPIGGFQAVKHRCADMSTRAEVASAQVFWAALALGDQRPDAGAHALAARVVANQSAITNSQTNVQNHGGIGFTWEHSAHRFVTRARVLGLMLSGLRSCQHALLAQPTPS